jgi:hypothetical protein
VAQPFSLGGYTMRTIAIIFIVVGLFLLLRLVDFRLQIIPLPAYGAEGGLIEIGIDTVFGGGATLLGLLFAIIHFVRTRQSKFARFLLVWCCLQLLGFIGFFVYDDV